MRLDTRQQLKLQQQMKLSPRIIQAMEILQLPMMGLLERIDAELQANPVLELDEQASEPLQREEDLAERGEQDLVIQENDSGEDFQRLADFTDEYGLDTFSGEAPPRPPADSSAGDRKLEAMANTPAPAESLTDYLLEQWRFVDVEPAIAEAGRQLISYIEPDGYLRTPLEEIAARSEPPVTVETLRTALAKVQTLEPLGVAARDLRECLLLQLQAEAAAGRDVSLEIELVGQFLRDIEKNRLPKIARKLSREVGEIREAIDNLSHLTPRPGSLIGAQAAPAIRPDAIVELDENGEVVVTLPDEDTPRLHISRRYRRMARDRETDKDARQFLQRNLRSAQWLMDAILQRRSTIRRVVEAVFEVQKPFLEHGREALRPLPMSDVAETVGVHVATVSRAVAGKYVQTPQGIDPLRMFFSGGTKTAGGEDVSWDAVKARLQEVVEAEDKKKPLSDDALAAELKKSGIDIARRTVAKYRSLLDIPPARNRRQY
jgi:RNA polymerase sigma-54 factor